jgi:threonine dehydrogenase-like Zn-dependent dehydrogenase
MKATVFRQIGRIEVMDVAQRRVDVDALVTHEISLEEVVTRGLNLLETPASGAVKIMVKIGGES